MPRLFIVVLVVLLSSCSKPESGDWSFNTSKDKITDAFSYIAFAPSKRGPGSIIIACDERADGRLTIKLLIDRVLYPTANQAMFFLRVDSKAPIFSRWEVEGKTASLSPPSEGIKHLADYIGDGSNLVVRMSTADDEKFDMELPVQGTRKAISWMSGKCLA